MSFKGRATAQTILPPVIVSGQRQVCGDNDNWREVAAAGSPIDNQRIVLAAFEERPLLSIDGGLNFVPGPDLFGGDPFVTSTPLSSAYAPGRIFVGGIVGGNKIKLTYHDPGNTAFSDDSILTVVESQNGLPDKPWMTVGSGPSPLGEIVHLVAYNRSSCGPVSSEGLERSISSVLPSWTHGQLVPQSPASMCDAAAGCHYNGWGVMPVTLDNGDIVAVVRDTNLENHANGCYNDGMPYVIWSLNGGTTWLPAASSGLRLGAGLTAMMKSEYARSEMADTPFDPDRRKFAPSIAVDRHTTPNTVYVAFAARRIPYSGATDENADIWIFRGSRQEPSQDFSFEHVLHLTDELLNTNPQNPPGDPDTNPDGKGPDQWLPAIAIDCGGGINLTFYDNRVETQAPTVPDSQLPSPGRMADVYYAHIRNWPSGTPSVYTKRLTPVSFPVKQVGFTDYMTLASAGPNGQRIYPVYIAAKQLSDNVWSDGICYIHQVVVRNCAVDLNLNGLADGTDIDWYLDDFAESLPEADLTTDGMVNSDDLDEFVASYEEMEQP